MKKQIQNLILLVALLFPFFAMADTPNIDITFEDEPLFNEANFLPGDAVSRWIKVENLGTETKQVATRAINYPDPVGTDDLSRALKMTIKKNGIQIWIGTLYEFFLEDMLDLTSIAPGETHQYDYSVLFPEEKENEWQGKSTYFDIQLGYSDGSDNPPEDDDDPITYGGGGGGGGGCANKIIESTVNVELLDEDSVRITWETTCKTNTQIVISNEDDSSNFDPSLDKYGYDIAYPIPADPKLIKEHGVTLHNLPCGPYYFRAASGHPMAISRQYSFRIPCVEDIPEDIGEYIPPVFEYTVTEGTEPYTEVAGEKTEKEEPEVKGVSNFFKNIANGIGNIPMACTDIDYLPWLVLAVTGSATYIERRKLAKIQKMITQRNNFNKFNS